MPRSLPVMLLVVVLGVAGCGDDGGSSASAYCDQLKKSAKEATAPTTTATGPSTTIDYKALQKRFDDALGKIASKAPAELKDDYDVVNEYFSLYLKALAKDPAADTAKLQALAPKYKTSQEAIAKYNKDKCNFENTTVPPASQTTAKS